ncbi:MAG: hypothetical protein N3A64_00825, partial [Desulfobacterota bacterium]|nr:hypothetical protein [Thermodesulfobacteriota bacterium]
MAENSIKRPLWVIKLGEIDYEVAWSLQNFIKKARIQKKADNTLILLQHPPVITLGQSSKEDDILAKTAELERKGIKLFVTDRGGKVTYHGPGQLIGYPILELKD